MIINYTLISFYFLAFIAYMLFCRFAPTLITFFQNLKNDSFNESEKLRERYNSQYSILVKNPSDSYKERNSKLNPGRSYYKTWLFVSIALILFNSFILAAFLNNIGGLASPILIDPIRINYSHLIAGVIVMVELLTGVGYFIAYNNQQTSEDPIWAFLKFFSILAFICLIIVETIMWANLSVNFEMSDQLRLESNNVFRNFVDYFLSALGIGITLFEFTVGYFSSQYREYSGDSSLLYSGRFFILGLGLILLLFTPSVLLLIAGAIIVLLVTLINFVILPGNYLYDKIFRKKTTSSIIN
jgi:hypothetical protein